MNLQGLYNIKKTSLVNIRHQPPFLWVPVLLLGSSQLGLNVEELNFKIATLCVPELKNE